MPTIELDLESAQLVAHINFYNKVIFTNGLKWVFYDGDRNPVKNEKCAPVKKFVIGEITQKTPTIIIDWYKTTIWKELCKYINKFVDELVKVPQK